MLVKCLSNMMNLYLEYNSIYIKKLKIKDLISLDTPYINWLSYLK